MPFTPLHMGPGLLIKSLSGKYFSFPAFAIAQLAMDIEPLIGMLLDSKILHGPTHTYLAALFIGAIVTAMAPLIISPILRRWNQEIASYRLTWLNSPPPSRLAIATAVLIGTFSHVALDSIMHSEMTPLAPYSYSNILLGLLPLHTLYGFCFAGGIVGFALWLLLAVLHRSKRHED